MIRTKIFILALFLSFFSSHAFSQKVSVNVFMENKSASENSDTIYYNFNRKLTWKDFQGTPNSSVPWGAMTGSGFSFNSSMNDDGDGNIAISVGVYCFFTKHDSWKKSNVNSDYHLEHEQHHFDISMLHAEELVQEIKKAHFTGNNFQKVLNSIFDKVYNESIAMQDQYDKETRNSMDEQKQAEWNKKISDEIGQLKIKN